MTKYLLLAILHTHPATSAVNFNVAADGGFQQQNQIVVMK